MSGGGASTLLSIVPDGSDVEKGDVLAVLDSSDYEELLRQQQITVERSTPIIARRSSTSKSPSCRPRVPRRDDERRRGRTCWASSRWPSPT